MKENSLIAFPDLGVISTGKTAGVLEGEESLPKRSPRPPSPAEIGYKTRPISIHHLSGHPEKRRERW
ncbi:hypothetical protein CEXT_159921 [Caerostris extrusa]|uniref:Uncharacterized protein n=1 Tax=Caerostris extrusa TaxID=172846 RepID=A0AAV4TSZ2_CAEEX|nr:hypothetical protein CEXT_159921 [Caerostris extrusa]